MFFHLVVSYLKWLWYFCSLYCPYIALYRKADDDLSITLTFFFQVLLNSKLPIDVLGRVWELADIDKDGMLDNDEFAVV